MVEPIDWSIKWDGYYITKNLLDQYGIKARTLKTSRRRIAKLRNEIIHFGSRNTYLPEYYKYVHDSNDIIMTWFHGTDDDLEYIKLIPEANKRVKSLHTSCSRTKKYLIKWGFPEAKIKVLPIGIDTSIFRPISQEEKVKLKSKYEIPPGHICVGSFQKDGEGFGEGDKPKLIKGPDIFCSLLERLNKYYPIFALLSGPARGYVKNRLSRAKIPYKHLFLKNYPSISNLYNLLDLYIITSRAEGGPKALLECFASGVPLVSSDVGMVTDIGINNYNLLKCGVDDIDCLLKNSMSIINNTELKDKLVKNGLDIVKSFDWKNNIKNYYEQLYQPLLIKKDS